MVLYVSKNIARINFLGIIAINGNKVKQWTKTPII